MSTALATLDTNLAAQYVAGEGYDLESAIAAAAAASAGLRENGLLFGLHLLAIREREPHGGYLAALERLGVHPRTAQRFVPRVAFLLQNKHTTALAHLTGEQLDQLRKLPVPLETVYDAAAGTLAGRPLAEAASLPTNHFRALIWRYAEDPTGTAEPAPAPKRDPLIDLAGQIKRLPPEQRSELFRKLGVLKAMDDTAYKLVKRTASDA